MHKLVPVIAGSAKIPNSREVLFSNLVSITDGIMANIKPDFYNRARPDNIDAAVSNDLNSLIIPSSINVVRRLVAPSFFLEAKAP